MSSRRVAIVGLGLMGASLGLALKRAGWSVSGRDSDPSVVQRALERGVIDSEAGDLAAVDLVVVAVPLPAMRSALAALPRGVLATDLCSTKTAVLRWAQEFRVDLVGGHPLCGSEQSGIDAAREDLYQRAPWALSRADPLVEEMVVEAGAHPLVVDAAEHDRLVAASSHAAFLLSAAYMLAASEAPDWPALAALTGSGFRDMTRLAAGDPEMYEAIVGTNRDNILERLDQFQVALERLRLVVEADDSERLTELFEQARSARARWEAARG